MNTTTKRLSLLLGCALAFGGTAAHAQSASACPQLPADSGLVWQQRGNDAFLICSAVTREGEEAFGLSLSADSPFQPRRGNREERGTVGGREVRWYRAEVGTQPGLLVRETLVELERDRVAHIWVRTRSEELLQSRLGLVEQLEFDAPRLSSN